MREKVPNLPPRPKVSIVTPSYNQSMFIEKTIRSVLMQDYPNIEYLVIDGGSTDKSKEIIRRYENSLAYWVSEPDDGQADAINKGWKRSTGDILAWINSDDYYEPNAVKNAVSLLQRYPDAVAVCGAVNIINDKGKILRIEQSKPVDLRKMLHFRGIWSVQQPAVFVRRRAVEQAGWLDPKVYFLLDVDLFLRVLKYGRFVFSDSIWANFRLWPSSKTCFEGPPPGELEYIISKHWPNKVFRLFIFWRDIRNRLGIRAGALKLISKLSSLLRSN